MMRFVETRVPCNKEEKSIDFSQTIEKQKFRVSDAFTKEITKELI